MRKKERNTRHKLIEEFTCWHQIQQPKKRNQKGWSFSMYQIPHHPHFPKNNSFRNNQKALLTFLFSFSTYTLAHNKRWKPRRTTKQSCKTNGNHETRPARERRWGRRKIAATDATLVPCLSIGFKFFKTCRSVSVVSEIHTPRMHTQEPPLKTQRKKSPNQKKTTLPAGKNTPNTSSTRTTPPSVSRGRISVETPTLDTGPFTLPLFWGREQAERPAAWIWNGTTSKHTWLSPFCLLGVRVSFSQNKKRTLTPFITSYVHSAQDELHQTTTSLTTVFSTFKNTLSHCFQYD